jgi:hypothetical protein
MSNPLMTTLTNIKKFDKQVYISILNDLSKNPVVCCLLVVLDPHKLRKERDILIFCVFFAKFSGLSGLDTGSI